MCVCFCTFFIKVHDPSLRLTPQNPHSRKSRAKKFLISKFCFYLHLHIAIPCFDGQMEEAFLLESSTFETMTTISWDAHPQLGLTPQTEPPATVLSKRARLIAIPRITAVRVNCWCPLEFDICQSLAIVGGCCFCVLGNFSWGNNDLIKMTNNIFCGQFSWDIAKMPMLIHP